MATTQQSAKKVSLLRSHDIAYVLSASGAESPQLCAVDEEGEGGSSSHDHQSGLMMRKKIDIRDDATEYLLQHSKSACDWIEASLQNDVTKSTGVLVHSTRSKIREIESFNHAIPLFSRSRESKCTTLAEA